MYALTRPAGTPTLSRPVPNRPAISDVLLKANANVSFRKRLLTDPKNALAGMNLPPEDLEILTEVATSNLKEFARQVQMRLVERSWGAQVS
ncbi:MAG: hypothetical protein DDG58_06375 [Ardenticatenia bacterium]|jgi:hypothetical protein|nr:MAG: hypothetical protein DDG58_06375 [Ardenticatenia bacterium]